MIVEHNHTSKNKSTSKSCMWLIVLVIAVALLTLAVYFVWDSYSNGSEYRSVVKQCGTESIIYGYSNPKNPTLHYVRPTDPDYSPPFPGAHYFCTEQEAVDAGYVPLYNQDGSYNQD